MHCMESGKEEVNGGAGTDLRSQKSFRRDELGDESSRSGEAKCAELSSAAVSLPARPPQRQFYCSTLTMQAPLLSFKAVDCLREPTRLLPFLLSFANQTLTKSERPSLNGVAML